MLMRISLDNKIQRGTGLVTNLMSRMCRNDLQRSLYNSFTISQSAVGMITSVHSIFQITDA